MALQLQTLKRRLAGATGQDRDLDRAIAEIVDRGAPATGAHGYTSSVDACLALIGAVLPDWHWHVGHGPNGILPYASLSKETIVADGGSARVEATAATVPIALLHAMVKALIMDEKEHEELGGSCSSSPPGPPEPPK